MKKLLFFFCFFLMAISAGAQIKLSYDHSGTEFVFKRCVRSGKNVNIDFSFSNLSTTDYNVFFDGFNAIAFDDEGYDYKPYGINDDGTHYIKEITIGGRTFRPEAHDFRIGFFLPADVTTKVRVVLANVDDYATQIKVFKLRVGEGGKYNLDVRNIPIAEK